jgi:hypothetical protein
MGGIQAMFPAVQAKQDEASTVTNAKVDDVNDQLKQVPEKVGEEMQKKFDVLSSILEAKYAKTIAALHQENTALKEDLGKANKRAKQDHKTIEEVLQKHYKQSCIIAKLNRELNESTAGKLCLLAKAVAAQASEMTKMRTEMHKILAYVKCKP